MLLIFYAVSYYFSGRSFPLLSLLVIIYYIWRGSYSIFVVVIQRGHACNKYVVILLELPVVCAESRIMMSSKLVL